MGSAGHQPNCKRSTARAPLADTKPTSAGNRPSNPSIHPSADPILATRTGDLQTARPGHMLLSTRTRCRPPMKLQVNESILKTPCTIALACGVFSSSRCQSQPVFSRPFPRSFPSTLYRPAPCVVFYPRSTMYLYLVPKTKHDSSTNQVPQCLKVRRISKLIEHRTVINGTLLALHARSPEVQYHLLDNTLAIYRWNIGEFPHRDSVRSELRWSRRL